VLITGESGTGKELVARTLHRLSPRSGRPFVAVNCSAIPATLLESEILGHEKGAFTGATVSRAGCFEQAADGTLFLDEIGEMPADLQSKLLRVLEDGKVRRVGGNTEIAVDVRVVAATNADVERLLEQGGLRPDLYFRLNVFTLRIPSLRERREDIPLLAEQFLEEFRSESRAPIAGFSAAALDLLTGYGWPGNVRELRNAVHQAVILCGGGEIQPENLPSSLRPGSRRITGGAGKIIIPVGISIAQAEKALILETLAACSGDKPKAARSLGISLKTLYTRLREYERR
jgi:DNA-binding NtrC family response regulator